MAHSNANNVRLSVAFLQWNASASVLISYFIPVLNILRNPEYIFNTQNEQVNQLMLFFIIYYYYYLLQGGCVLIVFVCVNIILSVNTITQKPLNKFR